MNSVNKKMSQHHESRIDTDKKSFYENEKKLKIKFRNFNDS
jgi:hypothetical protein